jgi:tetratricopeptide (TPR) repeat protein
MSKASLKYVVQIVIVASAVMIAIPGLLRAELATVSSEKKVEPSGAMEPDLDLRDTLPMREIYHPVSTDNPTAQKSFNKGLTFIFAFNHDLAFKEFEKASQFDPNLAMAYWGMALALGQNINTDVTPEHEKRAYDYSQKALTLISRASPVEQAYIKALVQRYTNDPSGDLVALRYKYRDAMKEVSTKYPEDLDAACLYAESILDIDPWKYWTWDGKPKAGTLEAIDVLRSVLDRNPEHIGANHYSIHAWEESPTPERALLSAFRLTHLLPESGHLMHMPCHIFILCGYYDNAIKTSKKAIAADREYIHEHGIDGDYPLHYLTHNMRVLSRIYMLSEDYENAIRTADELNQLIKPYYKKMPDLLRFMMASMEVNLYFHRWKEILAFPRPPEDYAATVTYWYFSRAMALINLGDVDAYRKERNLMMESKQKIKDSDEIGNNPAFKIFELGEILLDAAQARFFGEHSAHIENLKKAVEVQDRLNYDEPPAWYVLSRIELGKAFLVGKRYEEAEMMFKKGLTELQRNGRLLFGLHLSLKEQGRAWDAYWVEREMNRALKNSSQQLTLDNL